MYTTRKTCRLCEGPLVDVISLGDIHLSTFLDTADAAPPKIPLELVQCTKCDLVQLRHTTDSSAMYSDYWYQSGLNGSMVKALANVVEEVFKRIALNEGDIVVDIGGNDGTLLGFYPRYLTKVMFEPSNLFSLAQGKADIIINDYFNKQSYGQHVGIKAKVITAIAMFYDLEKPHDFVQDLKDILATDGLIVIQMMDLLSMMKYGDFPNICHEHLEYYSLAVFKKLMEEHDLQIVDVEYNGVNGGSMRAYIQHKGYGVPHVRVQEALEAEQSFFDGIGDIPTYFSTLIESVRDKVLTKINNIISNGQTIAVMGASTKGNTILQYFGLNGQHIIHAAEINPDKYGKRTVGSNIPIISQKESMRHMVDYYFILPWGFIDNFIDRNRTYLEAGGKFLVPLPIPRIIGSSEGKLWIESL